MVSAEILPDGIEPLKGRLIEICDQYTADLILTTGGTGFSERDLTPEATLEAAERLAPGISEAMRLESLKITKRAMLSRGVSVIRKRTLIINLPGAQKQSKKIWNVSFPHFPTDWVSCAEKNRNADIRGNRYLTVYPNICYDKRTGLSIVPKNHERIRYGKSCSNYR